MIKNSLYISTKIRFKLHVQYACFTYILCVFFIGISQSAWAKVNVVATLGDFASITKSIGGQYVKVFCLAHPLEDPHYVDGRPNFIVNLSYADILIENGLELELSWLDPLLVDSRNPKMMNQNLGRLTASNVISPLEVPAQVDRSQGDIHAQGNPHYSSDPRQMLLVIDAITDRLTRLDPAHQKDFYEASQKLKVELQAWMTQIEQKFNQLSSNQKKIITYHRSYSYLADWLNLKIPVYAEPKPGVPPSPAHLARVLQIAKENNIKVVVQESYYPQRTLKVISKLAKAKHLVWEGQTRFDKDESYMQHMKKLIDPLYKALSKP
jgi:zinc/manganese transport system substrate-binding protein